MALHQRLEAILERLEAVLHLEAVRHLGALRSLVPVLEHQQRFHPRLAVSRSDPEMHQVQPLAAGLLRNFTSHGGDEKLLSLLVCQTMVSQLRHYCC